MTAWNGQTAWFDTVLDVLNTPEGEHARRTAAGRPVAHQTLCRVALADAAAADRATGRGVTTAHETVALQLGISGKTVQRARLILEHLGLAKTIVVGRYLTHTERTQARSQHGGHQVRAASRRSLTTPKSFSAQKSVQLPRRGEAFKHLPLKKSSSTRNTARKSVAPLPPALNSKGAKVPARVTDRTPQPLVLLKLAAQLVQALPRIGQNRHLGAVAHMLTRSGIDATRWSSAESLINRINAGHTRRGLRRTYAGAEQKDPLAYLAWQIRTTIDPAEPTPLELQEQQAAQRAQRRREQQAERDAETTRVQAIDPAEVARFFEEDRKRYPRLPKPSRR